MTLSTVIILLRSSEKRGENERMSSCSTPSNWGNSSTFPDSSSRELITVPTTNHPWVTPTSPLISEMGIRTSICLCTDTCSASGIEHGHMVLSASVVSVSRKKDSRWTDHLLLWLELYRIHTVFHMCPSCWWLLALIMHKATLESGHYNISVWIGRLNNRCSLQSEDWDTNDISLCGFLHLPLTKIGNSGVSFLPYRSNNPKGLLNLINLINSKFPLCTTINVVSTYEFGRDISIHSITMVPSRVSILLFST